MGTDTRRTTPHGSHAVLTAQEPPPHSSDQVLACLLILPRDAEPIVSLLKNLAASVGCPAAFSFNGGPDSANAIDDLWLNHAKAADYLGISKSTLYQYASRQKIECRKLGGRLEYRRATLDQFKAQQIRPAQRLFHSGV